MLSYKVGLSDKIQRRDYAPTSFLSLESPSEVSSQDLALMKSHPSNFCCPPDSTDVSWRECGSSEVGSDKIPLLDSLPKSLVFLSDYRVFSKTLNED